MVNLKNTSIWHKHKLFELKVRGGSEIYFGHLELQLVNNGELCSKEYCKYFFEFF